LTALHPATAGISTCHALAQPRTQCVACARRAWTPARGVATFARQGLKAGCRVQGSGFRAAQCSGVSTGNTSKGLDHLPSHQ